MEPRETILARLLVVAQGLDGVQAVARNSADVPGLARPAFLIHDGSETLLDKPDNERFSRLLRMEMAPLVAILVHASEPSAGTLLNIYRARFLAAVISDAGILAAIGGNGEIRYEGCSLEPATAEAKERRLELNLVFMYPFRASDL